MNRKRRLALGVPAVILVGASIAVAADHNDADGTKADEIADIDDVYAWHTDAGKIVAIVTFGGPGADPAMPPGAYDPDVLYTLHLDNDGDNVSEHQVLVRYGQDSLGDWGVQFEGIPGGTATVSGPVDTTLDAGNGLSAIAGVFDDPFFFDFTGLTDTLATGTVSFQASRDSFAGKNVNAFVVEIDTATVTASSEIVRVWATSGRK